MALIRINNIRVSGLAACVPKNIVKTVSTTDKYDDESYIESVGVREKRFSNDFTTADLCEVAAKKLISDLGWEEGIELLILATQTPDYILPATACVLHGKLGLNKSCLALDINLGCSGWVYAMTVALSMMSCGQIRRAIVLAGDARKQVPEEHDQLFGYAGTATALEFDEKASPITIDLGTDGTGYDAIIRPGGGARNPITIDSLKLEECEDGRKRHACQTRMKGMDVFAFGITTAPKSIKKVAKAVEVELSEVDYVVFHQANIKMLETIRKKLKLKEESVPYSLRLFGNTSSASIPLTIVTELKNNLIGKESSIIGCGFGVGLSWGSIHFITSDDIVISELQEV
ncbi:MAG: ketoacyl-ACP synthase III [Veillonella sp.]|nr:ketoacyl-ACP synthase III [Veillonella sp.]